MNFRWATCCCGSRCPQFIIVYPLATLLRRVDGRWVLAFGAAMVGVGLPDGDLLTSESATEDFLPSQVVQAIGQSFALTAVIVLVVRSINPADALTVGSLLQISRLFGGEIGNAFMQTFVRVREQVHSNLVGLHIDSIAGHHRPACRVQRCDRRAYRGRWPSLRAGGEASGQRGDAAGIGACLHRWLSRRRRRFVRVPAVGRRHAPRTAFAVLRPPSRRGCLLHQTGNHATLWRSGNTARSATIRASAAATRAMTGAHSLGRVWRNMRRVGYHGLSSRPLSQRQQLS